MRNTGFSLTEVMIVVAIIALLVASSIPNLLRTRIQANESATQAALKALAVAESEYKIANPEYGSLEQLGAPSSGPPYIDPLLAGGVKNGYVFDVALAASDSYLITAIPSISSLTGVRSFCLTEDGVIRARSGGGAIPDHDSCLILSVATQ